LSLDYTTADHPPVSAVFSYLLYLTFSSQSPSFCLLHHQKQNLHHENIQLCEAAFVDVSSTL